MVRTQVYLPEELKDEALLTASGINKSFSDLVREGLELAIKKNTKKKKNFGEGFIGAGKGGPKDLSSKIDYYLYVEPYENKKKKK